MSDYETNPYYSPGASGLAIVGDLDAGGGYDFDMLVVWQRIEDGALFWSTDSGCSCPSPFEDVNSVDDLTSISDPREFSREARAWLREKYGATADDRYAMDRLIRKVQRLAKKAGAVA